MASSSQDSRIDRAKCQRWDVDRATVADGFVEVENVYDGTVRLAVMNEDVGEILTTWLEPAKARKVAQALIERAQEIDGRPS